MRLSGLVLMAAAAMAAEPEFIIAGLRVLPDRWDKESNFRKLDRYAREAVSKGAR